MTGLCRPATSSTALSHSGSSRGSSSSDRTVEERPREIKRQRAVRRPTAKAAKRASPGAASATGRERERTCRVPGCTAELAAGYQLKYRICSTHYVIPAVAVGEHLCRFCQQCSKLHALVEFDAGRRSCRSSLEKHQQARTLRKRRSQKQCSPDSQRRSQRPRRIGPAQQLGKERQRAGEEEEEEEQQQQHVLRQTVAAEPRSLQAQQRELQEWGEARPAAGAAAPQPAPPHGPHSASGKLAVGAAAAAVGAALSTNASSSSVAAPGHELLRRRQSAAAPQSLLPAPFGAPAALPPPPSLAAMQATCGSEHHIQFQHQALRLQQAVLQWQAGGTQRERLPQAASMRLPPSAPAPVQLGDTRLQAAAALQHVLLRMPPTLSMGTHGERAPHGGMVQQALELLQHDTPLSDYVPSERELEQLSLGVWARVPTPAATATAAPLWSGRAQAPPAAQNLSRQGPAALGSFAAAAAAAALVPAAASVTVEVPQPLAPGLPALLAGSGSTACASLPALKLPASADTLAVGSCRAEVEVSLLPSHDAQQGRQHPTATAAPAGWSALPPLPALADAPTVPVPGRAALTGAEAADWLSRFLL